MQKSKKRYHQVSYLKQKIIEKLSISLFSFCSPLDGGLDNVKCLMKMHDIRLVYLLRIQKLQKSAQKWQIM
jgi:hypothetical protein